MSEMNRELFIENLKKFIEEQRNWLQNTMKFVGWNFEYLDKLAKNKQSDFVICPNNIKHRMPVKSLENHLSKCDKKFGLYPCITDELEINNVANETCKSENLSLIDNSSSNQSEIQENNNQASRSSKCLKELLIAERDSKRRRAAHRGKRVHTNKKSYNEIMREVIASQMETLGLSSIETECSKTNSNTLDGEVSKVYLGVGDPFFKGNPYKRWLTIEKEEHELSKHIQKIREERNHFSRKELKTNKDYEARKKVIYGSDDHNYKRRYHSYDNFKKKHEKYDSKHQKYNKYEDHSNFQSREENSDHEHEVNDRIDEKKEENSLKKIHKKIKSSKEKRKKKKTKKAKKEKKRKKNKYNKSGSSSNDSCS